MDSKLLQRGDLGRQKANPIHWLWHDYFATGMVTLLTSRWKTGKSTLLARLLERMVTGQPIGGAPFTAQRAVIVSEEPAELWHQRMGTADLGGAVQWLCQPFGHRPRPQDWMELLRIADAQEPDFVAIDTLSYFLPDDRENSCARLLAALEPLHRLTQAGTSVVLTHHPRKAVTRDDFSPRGSGALTAFADILVQLDMPRYALPQDRRRVLRCTSRLRGTSLRTMELSADGRDYVLLPEPSHPDCFEAGWPVLKTIFEDSSGELSRKEIQGTWPDDHDAPSPATLKRWLAEAVKQGCLARNGRARKNDPYRYFLPNGSAASPPNDSDDDLGDLPPLGPLPEMPRP